ncbi:hypothetical protein [Actinokineospora enzanensis]|uniref:hypothetical protein n=1 Tax=Actinokineospora enzanensis TaxID=155975 RepID=UPI00035DA15A|nr:hypothetical protein [Actinokineospora enzanensis]
MSPRHRPDDLASRRFWLGIVSIFGWFVPAGLIFAQHSLADLRRDHGIPGPRPATHDDLGGGR